VELPIEYATQVLDKNHTGLLSIQQIAKDPFLKPVLPLISKFGNNTTKNGHIIINSLNHY